MVENWHRIYKHFNHNKAVHALFVQTWCPFSTDQVEEKPILTLKHTHTVSHTYTETHWNSLFWLQYVENSKFCFIQINGTPSVLFPVRSGKKQFNYKEYILFPGHRQLWQKQQLTFGLDVFRLCLNDCGFKLNAWFPA